jgi:hypothetical protein
MYVTTESQGDYCHGTTCLSNRQQSLYYMARSWVLSVTLRLTVSKPVSLSVEPILWTFDQILLPFQEFGSEICPVSVGRPL